MSAIILRSSQNPPDGGAREVLRRLTARLLQYPHTSNARPEVIERTAACFHPKPDIGQPLPVAGIGMMNKPGSPQVIVFTTNKDTVLTEEFHDEFSSGLSDISFGIRSTGAFRLCASGGDSLGFGTPGGETGTLGCVVEDSANDDYALSANHVIALENKGVIGVDEVWSPGPADGGASTDKIGVLSDFQTVDLGGVKTNAMDAAIAKLNTTAGAGMIVTIGKVAGVDATSAYNSRVQKYGIGTKHTWGDLTFKNMSLLLPFGGGLALFVDQYGLVGDHGLPFAGGGDSGSLVLNKSAEAVGLIMAVAGSGEIAVANPIEPVLKRFGVSF